MFYGITIIVTLLISGVFPKNGKIVYAFAILLSILIGLRDESTPDTIGYIEYFGEIHGLGDGEFPNTKYEPSFEFVSRLVKLLFDNSSLYLFTCALIINILFANAIIKISKISSVKTNNLMNYLIYFSFFGLFYSSIVIRQGFALAICYWIYIDYIYRKEKNVLLITHKFLYLILFVVAFFFHYSSILCVVIFPLLIFSRILPINTYKLILLFCVLFLFSGLSKIIVSDSLSSFLSFTSQDTLFSRYDYYEKDLKNAGYNISFRLLFQIFIGYYLLLIPSANNMNSYFKLYNIYIIGLLLSCIFSSISQIARLIDAFLLAGVLLLSWNFGLSSKQHKNSRLFAIITILLFFVFFIRVFDSASLR